MEVDEKSIQPGSEVNMHYRITLEDGTVADATEGDDVLQFTMGDGTLIEGLELALYGLKEGDSQTLTIDPDNAFGYADEDNVHDMPRDEFPPEFDLKPGLIVEFTTPSGETLPGAIREVQEDRVSVDFNHPLAGHTIEFWVEILAVKQGSAPVGSA
jgi:FKBP-type peptidyl-prolyl cis-trans isomerase SlpA